VTADVSLWADDGRFATAVERPVTTAQRYVSSGMPPCAVDGTMVVAASSLAAERPRSSTGDESSDGALIAFQGASDRVVVVSDIVAIAAIGS
jgi:hypothetical protein